MDEITKQTQQDLYEDFDELLYLYTSTEKQLVEQEDHIKKASKFIIPQTYRVLMKLIIENQEILKQKIREIKYLQKEGSVEELMQKKAELFDHLRSQKAIIASLITATDWQSPSASHSIQSMAGKQTGEIITTMNDYKRDHHLDEQNYQDKFLKEYVDGIFKMPVHIYLTSSGMGAFSTILGFLMAETNLQGSIIIGKSIYFQNKELVEKFFRKRVIEVDETNTDQIINVIKTEKPSIIIFDSLCNSSSVAMPNLSHIIKTTIKLIKDDVYFIIDNSCLSVSFQPLSLVLGKTKKVHLIVFESLNKYYQFGMDKVTAGIIWAIGKDTGKLFFLREHMGTNIIDSSVYVLPVPNRKALITRLKRFERNTKLLAEALQRYIDDDQKSNLAKIVYPGLSNHPSFSWAKNISFHGSYFVFEFKEKFKTIKYYKKFIGTVLEEAKRKNVQIALSTSFGFQTSRIYLTSLRTDFGEPFVRFAVGTESMSELKELEQVLLSSIKKFSKNSFLF